ncbi:4-phosphopantetheinyl transferase [Candidatus Francisella endociliophora]|uniref:4-phosphopantetheinyl transferase n=1 Tax=Candidatus Francisella endociliophora TaxID=653937 RepID=A0A097EPM7_9GAMM|nr:4'-phosphopantetheinyl transferase superfamily protein [Francisella sp. FSC1006]AIT09529.1 4-phosphopantetheinyl transferase [Francisella sp. FSC1006]
MSEISAFILDFKKYKAELLKSWLVSRVEKEKLTSDQKIFSQFIRYFVFEKFFDISPVFSITNSKPYLANGSLFFNISHTQDQIVMTVSNSEVGIDAEEVNKTRNILKIAKRYFDTNEYASLVQNSQQSVDFYTLWTLKEAQVKRSSLGIAKELREAIFYKNENQQWLSEKYQNDFVTVFHNDLVISICCENIMQKQISFFEIDNFEFKKV